MTVKRQGCYVISIAARMAGVHAQTLRYYERAGLIEPCRSQGNLRLYSEEDISKIQRIRSLMDDLGINLASVEIILHMAEQMAQLQKRLQELENELEKLRELI